MAENPLTPSEFESDASLQGNHKLEKQNSSQEQREAAAESEASERQQALEASRLAIEKEAAPAAHTEVNAEAERGDSHFMLTKALKDEAFRERLTAVQRHLNRPSRVFSSLIHQPAIESLSKAAEKTVARPLSLLSGAACAFIGTTLLVILSRWYGFSYNYLFMTFLFVGGFIVGILAEPLFKRFIR